MTVSYRAVCFDIDGTLYPIGTMNRRLAIIALRHPFFAAMYRRGRKEFRLHQGSFRQSIPLRWREAMIIQNRTGAEPVEPFSEAPYEATYRRLQNCQYLPMKRLFRKTRATYGVRRTLQRIRNNGLKVGVLTDFPLFEKLEGLGISDLVDFAASSDDIGFLKPDAHCFEYLLYNLKLEPSQILYVGDSYSKDIEGAAKVGIDAVLVNVGRKEASVSVGRYPLAKAVFCTWGDFDNWLLARMGDDK